MSHASSQTINFLAAEEGGRSPVRRMTLGLVHSIIAAIQREHARRRHLKVLASLDDRLLRDIGMCRSDIDGVVRRTW